MDRQLDAEAEWNALARHLRETGQMTSMPATGFGMPDLSVLRGQGALGPGTLPQTTPPPSDYQQYVDRYRHGVSPGEAATELGLAAAPLALGPLGAVGRAAARHPVVTGAVAGGLGLGSTEAGEPAKGDPRFDKLRAIDQEIMGHRSALERMATTNFKSTVARENASAPYLQAISGLEARKRTIEKELNDEAKAVANSSFAKQWPTLNALWPAVQWGGPVAVAALTKNVGNLAERVATAPWRRAVNAAEEALLAGDKKGAAYHVAKAGKHLDREPDGVLGQAAQGAGNIWRELVMPTVAGATVGMEASLFPSQYDRRNAPEGSLERAAAEQALGPDFLQSAAMGLGPGILGGLSGSHMFPSIGPGYRPVAESEALRAAMRKPRKKR